MSGLWHQGRKVHSDIVRVTQLNSVVRVAGEDQINLFNELHLD